MKQKSPKPFPSEGSMKEQIHYFTCVVEDIRSQYRAVMEVMDVRFAQFEERMTVRMREMEDRLTLKIDANTYTIKGLQQRVGSLEVKVDSVGSKVDRLFDKEKEQDQEIASLKLKLA